jgi:hypothetical protein
MNIQEFGEISIRGRVAYAICCFENALKYYSFDKHNWSLLLDRLWEYTHSQYLDDWSEKFAECTASAILENIDFSKKGIEHLNKNDYDKLRLLYQSSNDVIRSLSDLIFQLGSIDLYGRLINNSPNTLKALTKIISYMESNKIPLPDLQLFKKFKFEESNGWGNKFLKLDLMNG